jgi:hypothetical protein
MELLIMAKSHDSASTPAKPKNAPRSPQVTIEITQTILDEAIPRDSKHCMIAETISRTIPNARNVLVDTSTIRWSDPDKGLRYTYLTPGVVRDAIFKFDFGRKIEPFSFTLRGAWVSSARWLGPNKRISLTGWQTVKDRVKTIRSERKLDWDTLGKEIDINPVTLKARMSDADMPSSAIADKVETWLLRQTGEEPAPRVKSQADKVAGPVRLRTRNPKGRQEPELIGGRPPSTPANMVRRQFGIRAFDWKTHE